jgi:hypothetical protein
MATHAGTNAPRSWGLIARLKAFTERLDLDRRLAAGANEQPTPELARHAQVPRSWRVRHRLADGLEHALVEAVAPRRERAAAAPVERAAVLSAQDDLLRLVRALRSEPGPAVHGIAAVSLLLTDGGGPVFAPHPPGALREAAFQAAFHAEAG